MRDMDPKLRRAELFDALRRFLLQAAELRPQIIIFEDLHWMDKATEEFLVSTVDSIPSSRVLCLFTHRPGYLHPFGDRTYHTRITLPSLSSTDTLMMAQAILATKRLPAKLTDLIAQKAEGNPSFVEEVVKSLREMGVIQRQGERYVLTKPLDEIIVPDRVQDVLMARIDRLEEGPKKTLQLASVIGREFTLRLLRQLVGIGEQTESHLQELKAIELVHEKRLFPEATYTFKHALTQEVAYNSLLQQRRRELHCQLGEAMEALYADRLSEQYEVLAHHFACGQAWSKALEYLRKAADKASQAFATREAIALYDQALEISENLGEAADSGTVMDIHLAQSILAYVVSDFERSRSEAELLLDRARRAGDQIREGTALAQIAWASTWARDLDHAVLSARKAIEVAEPLGAKSVLGRSHFTIGFVHAVTGEHESAEDELGKALVMSQEAHDFVHRSLALAVEGLLKNWKGEYGVASQLQAEGLELAREHNLLMPLLFNFFLHGITLTGRGNYDEALESFEGGLTVAQKIGDEAFHHRILNSLGWLHSELGDLDRAIELNRQSAEVGRRRKDPGTLPNAELNLGGNFLAQGDLTLGQEFFEKIHRYAQAPDTSPWMRYRYSIRLYAGLGELWLSRGELDKAEAFLEQSLHLATGSNTRKNIVKAWRLKGKIALARRHWEDATGWLLQALELAKQIGNPPQLWKTHIALGQVHTARQESEHARQAYQAARDSIDHTNSRLTHPALRASLENSPLTREVYDLS